MRPATIRKLLILEYLPYAARLAAVAVIAVDLGHADAVRFLALWMMVRAAGALSSLKVVPLVMRRIDAAPEVRRLTLQRAGAVESASLLAEFVLIAVAAFAFHFAGQTPYAWVMALLAVGAPPPHITFLFRTHRCRKRYLQARPWAQLIAVGATALLYQANLAMIAAAIASASWLALAACFFGPRLLPKHPASTPFDWREAAALTAQARGRGLSYLLSKQILSVVLGPLGGFAARTGRGLRFHRYSTPLLERAGPARIAATASLAFAVALGVHVHLGEPSTLLVLAAVSRLAATALSAAIWKPYLAPVGRDEDDDDME